MRAGKHIDLDAAYPWWRLIARVRQWWGIRKWARKLAGEVADLND